MERNKWLNRPLDAKCRRRIFGFPLPGAASNTFSAWPSFFSGSNDQMLSVQLPGRERRIAEAVPSSLDELARRIADGISPALDKPFVMVGHCGAVPLILATSWALSDLGGPQPDLMVLSAWGAPHLGLHGRLSYADLDATDLRAELQDLVKTLGRPIPDGFYDMAMRILRADVEVQRTYKYRHDLGLMAPTRVVLWSEDEVMPASRAIGGWEELPRASLSTLRGGHGAFLECPASLIKLLDAEVGLDAPD